MKKDGEAISAFSKLEKRDVLGQLFERKFSNGCLKEGVWSDNIVVRGVRNIG